MMASQYLTCLLFVVYVFYVVSSKGAKAAQQPLTNDIEDPLEYKLIKLLNVHIGKDSSNFQSPLRDSIHSEFRNVLNGMRNELAPLDRAESVDGLQRTEGRNYQQLLEAIKTLITEASKDFSVSSSTCYDDVENFINRSPVGVSYDNQICTSSSTKPPYSKSLWKNSSYVPKNCKEIQSQGYNVSGVYKIQPVKTEKPLMVLCDMEIRGGGWIHIQKRYDGSQDFYLNWREYKFGFGDLEREFWLGLENIYSLTNSEKNELLVEIVDGDGNKGYAHYKTFVIGSERAGYALKVLGDYSGDAGDSLTHHLGRKFTTKDFDQDEHPENCAVLCSGAWWYKSCHLSNLNGRYRNAELSKKYEWQGMHWHGFKATGYSHSKSRMLIRPIQ